MSVERGVGKFEKKMERERKKREKEGGLEK